MKLYTSIPTKLAPYFKEQIKKYSIEYNAGNLENAWMHLEKAHILGQRYPYEHSYVHWKMLQFGFKIKSLKEIFGQIPRLIFGGVKSFVGKVPVGNPGGANVPPLQPFPIEKELQDIFAKAGVEQ
ncbi:DUF3703 domain-containing protein [Cyclobacterium amurskyense]|uniref:DUF3703 domain-containing protein n=1 Tax=Cyclobacterium amurskyense TaxID=320787 RepID=A0A0H4PIN9_9BACT|nr:DUF3703 domain-containing protein [Cyclobacterium amurskyense]AKP53979.1 hypothetical protein CA2015_4648 [Cyclobacterium amurskyense]|tara:strand:- start:2209 stop:2583 length:375 start_codon:yes stop_codon:yes gene_type:complete